VTGVGFCW